VEGGSRGLSWKALGINSRTDLVRSMEERLEKKEKDVRGGQFLEFLWRATTGGGGRGLGKELTTKVSSQCKNRGHNKKKAKQKTLVNGSSMKSIQVSGRS